MSYKGPLRQNLNLDTNSYACREAYLSNAGVPKVNNSLYINENETRAQIK